MAGEIWPTAIRRAALDYLTGVAAPFTGWLLALWTNDLTPDQNTVWADLTEATFDGYARTAAVDFEAAGLDVLDAAVAPASDNYYFLCTGTTTLEVVYGWALIDPAGPTIKLIKRLAEPVAINRSGDYVLVNDVELSLG